MNVIEKMVAYMGSSEQIDEKTDKAVELMKNELPVLKFLIEYDSEVSEEIIDVVKSAYASGLANVYKDALIEMEKEK